jgi:hypothetical protein
MRAVLGDDGGKLRADLVERRIHRDILERAIDAFLRDGQPLRAVMRLGELAALDAGIAAEHRVVGVALHLGHAALVDGDEHRAIGVAEAAETAANLGHLFLSLITS